MKIHVRYSVRTLRASKSAPDIDRQQQQPSILCFDLFIYVKILPSIVHSDIGCEYVRILGDKLSSFSCHYSLFL